jgi:hypothetical protein
LKQAIWGTLKEDYGFGKIASDLKSGWKGILIMFAVSLGFALTYVFCLKWFVKPLLYLSMLMILLFFLLLGAWSWLKMKDFQSGDGISPSNIDPAVYYKNNIMYCKAGAAIAWTIAFIYFCFIICCWKNIALGAAVMETSSAFVGQNLKVLVIPFFTYIFVFLFLTYWILAAVWLYCIGEPQPKPN